MFRSPGVFLIVTLLLAGSCGLGDSPDHSAEWIRVLNTKKAAASPTASPVEKQMYADALAAFVRTHPSHSRARQVYQHIQLDFARELGVIGRHRDAIRFYRAVLAADPTNADAARGLAAAADHLAVTREKFRSLERGMKQKDVASLLGKPIPGWIVRNDRREVPVEAWYYRKTDGGVAGVYFRDGKVFAADENSQAKLAPLR